MDIAVDQATDVNAASGGFSVHLANFDGPFDLLLQLISRHKMDVTEVSLSIVTDEFISFIRGLEASGQGWELDQATEFLVVAATLLDLKAARLLPSGEVEDEDLAVTDLTGVGRLGNGGDGLLDLFVRHGSFDFHLGEEVDRVLGTTVDFRVSLLTAEAFDFGYGHTLDADFGEGVLHFLEFEGFDDGDDELHGGVGIGWVRRSVEQVHLCNPRAKWD